MSLKLRRGHDGVPQRVDLLLPRTALPPVGEAVLDVADRRLTLEGSHVHAHDGTLAQDAGGLPQKVEVLAHVLFVCVHDDQVEGSHHPLTRLCREEPQGLQGGADAVADLVPVSAPHPETLAEAHNKPVQLQGMDLALCWQRLGKCQGCGPAETANLQDPVRLVDGDQPLQEGTSLRTSRPLRTHVDPSETLAVVPVPVLLLHRLPQLRQRRAALR
mmetsp:Transcript_8565/g.25998  ORF Transcript_8565/g.25998 Transcript_8565/m.25998 type:complete len:216 (+) Transcript_8565:473-1120(+)